MILGFRRDFDPLTAEDRGDPFCCPATLRRIVNRGKRLKLNEFRGFARQHAADVMPIAAHGDGGGRTEQPKSNAKIWDFG